MQSYENIAIEFIFSGLNSWILWFVYTKANLSIGIFQINTYDSGISSFQYDKFDALHKYLSVRKKSGLFQVLDQTQSVL